MRPFAAPALLTLLLAAAATAAPPGPSAGELLEVAEAQHADYLALEAAVEDCPEGQCSEAPALVAEFEALEVERAQLHSDRAELGSYCQCSELDRTIGRIDLVSGSVSAVVTGWEEEG